MRTSRDPLPARLTLVAIAHLLLLAWCMRALGAPAAGATAPAAVQAERPAPAERVPGR